MVQRRFLLDDDGLDTPPAQRDGETQTDGSAADDGDLGLGDEQGSFPCVTSPYRREGGPW